MYKVIFVDDEPWIADGLCSALDWQALGFQIAGCAYDAYEAMELIRRERVDLAIMDICMPEKSGIECAEEVTASGARCLFILLSGIGDFDSARRGISIGVVEYLLKPLNKEALRRSVLKALERMRGVEPAGEVDSEADGYEALVRQLVGYIETHYGEELHLAALAAQNYVNANYLSVLFKKYTGVPFGEYLARCRLRAAAQLLTGTGKSIAVIAEQCGYQDYGSFIRSFKRTYGMPPGLYRRRTRQDERMEDD